LVLVKVLFSDKIICLSDDFKKDYILYLAELVLDFDRLNDNNIGLIPISCLWKINQLEKFL
jgi:hypothetical protein